MIDYKKYPRLSGSLRAHSGIAEKLHYRGDIDELQRRREQEKIKYEREYEVKWDNLVALIRTNIHDGQQESEKVEQNLKQLRKYALEFAGNDSTSDKIDDVCVYLIDMFRIVQQIQISHLKQLKLRFPTHTSMLVNQTFTLIRNLIDTQLNTDTFLEQYDQLKRSKTIDAHSTSSSSIFGDCTMYHALTITIPSRPWEQRLKYDQQWYEQNQKKKQVEDEKDKFNAYLNEPATKQSSKSSSTTSGSKYTTKWLEDSLKLILLSRNEKELRQQEFCNLVFENLLSKQTNDELQTSLCDILGYDQIEFVFELIQNRQDIINGILENAKAKPRQIIRNEPSSVQGDKQQPNLTLSITVQTEQEKKVEKQIRKQERKQQQQPQPSTTIDNLVTPEMLRYEREHQLLVAMSKRNDMLATISGSGSQPQYNQNVKYPFVFDQLQEIKRTTAYIGGQNLLLPENTQRKTANTHDFVHIPAGEQMKPADTRICKELVKIAELDQLGQIIFKHLKTLNLIQSIVYKTAYFTNENMLISAPTGAGKTNIAMLAIINELRKHYDTTNSILFDSDFKIIYIAPMKALASEMVDNFSKYLAPIGIIVKELTGDMQLTKNEIERTHMIITTPEKWDVVTRKSTGDTKLAQAVRLLIIDEIHLLHEDRGPVIEALVARTLRQVEQSQSMIRIVGLSATLPNYIDIALFLRVNLHKGLFFFDGRFRPVPLAQSFIGIKGGNKMLIQKNTDDICYEKVLEQIKNSKQQVLVFVHARNATVRTALQLLEYARNQGDVEHFIYKPENNEQSSNLQYQDALKHIQHSKNVQLRDLFPNGVAMHHAGMLRADRNLVEKYFHKGFIKVLVCTATLAWGVNLPAHAVIIKGTELYDSKKGSFVDLSILDVLQIFGRAGRPQFDTNGLGIIITSYDKLQHYLSLLTRQNPIESQFIQHLADNLNAEVVLGTVTNVQEACRWLQYTYLNIRMHRSPITYGINHHMQQLDPQLSSFQKDLIIKIARELDQAKMVRFEEKTEYLSPTDLGRTASYYYINYETIQTINEKLSDNQNMNDGQLVELASLADEFSQIKVRDDELDELDQLYASSCHLPVKGGTENIHGKVNILIQCHISRAQLKSFSLISDLSYVNQNVVRLVRALFDIVLKRAWAILSNRLLKLAKTIEQRMWDYINPLWQLSAHIPAEILQKLDDKRLTPDKILDMDAKDIGIMIHDQRYAKDVKQYAYNIPQLTIESQIQPITRTVLRIKLTITPNFKWSDKIHGQGSEHFWIWIEDPDTDKIYHSEYFIITKKQVKAQEPQLIVFTIPIIEPLANQYYVKAVSDKWLGSDATTIISFQNLILPEQHIPHTELLDLDPLPITALGNVGYESLFKFKHFNPIQTQLFHCLYHTDSNVLLGSPTGSGKTIAAEIAIFRVFNVYPQMKCVYIAPLKALVRERISDWKVRFEQQLGKKVIELTGDFTPDTRALMESDVIVTTPEKWDGLSRSWQTRTYVKQVALLIIDEIHMLGEDRGPVLEVIVSRTNFISSHTEQTLRIIGLSTAVANARDLADWLGIKTNLGLYNFRPSVRPVPLEAHIQGYPGKNYCPRMKVMNKPCYQAIRTHSPKKPVLIFVSSRRQTRLTAEDLMLHVINDDSPKQWLHMPEAEMTNLLTQVSEPNLKNTLSFGIGIHHAGLKDRDRHVVEELFVNQRIQILVATSTLAWGVNFPAHLVIVKGTEYYDGKTHRYVDFPITDVLQMMGRAGRPQFDDQGKAVIMVHDVKKNFYKKFLYEPFPVESSLLNVLSDHLNAEIVSGTISTKQEAMDYMTWTYFFRRLLVNPTYYNLEEVEEKLLNSYLSDIIHKSFSELEQANCLQIDQQDQRTINSTIYGRIASHYYISYKTIDMFQKRLQQQTTLIELLDIISSAEEYAELPVCSIDSVLEIRLFINRFVRHSEDEKNKVLAQTSLVTVNEYKYDDPHIKANLLIQAHFSRSELPNADYYTDLKSVLDQIIRIIQALLDVSAYNGFLQTTIWIINFLQMVIQARWLNDSDLLTLPSVEREHLSLFKIKTDYIDCLVKLCEVCDTGKLDVLVSMLSKQFQRSDIDKIYHHITKLPQIELTLNIKGWWENDPEINKHVDLITQPLSVKQANDKIIRLHADQEYLLNVQLKRINTIRRQDFRVISPQFSKPRDEGWFLILGDIDKSNLLALKRVSQPVRNQSQISITFMTPSEVGRLRLTLFLLSDSYLGFDQQYDMLIDIIKPSIQSQVNTELDPLRNELAQKLSELA
ncbi:unnamed protein product [Didymodactylos carnosus]|uniref:Activating signal cointegrator 1 complex subunit 3 n=1 Tax=Didymodactylos carnosus TaxID=1234261 RepID=A0A813SAY0_9BILA|nr:unnamed protein product [Didymodactylos carnosus]CAF3578119.1 unnamed protein product [Didymodactylos carnosus]